MGQGLPGWASCRETSVLRKYPVLHRPSRRAGPVGDPSLIRVPRGCVYGKPWVIPPQKWGIHVKEKAGKRALDGQCKASPDNGSARLFPRALLWLLTFRLSLVWLSQLWDRCHRMHTAPFHSSKTQRKTRLKAREAIFVNSRLVLSLRSQAL